MERERKKEKQVNGEQLDEGLLLTRRRVIPPQYSDRNLLSPAFTKTLQRETWSFMESPSVGKPREFTALARKALSYQSRLMLDLTRAHIPLYTLIINAHVKTPLDNGLRMCAAYLFVLYLW